MGAAGVIGHHAPDGAARVGRGIRPIGKPVRGRGIAQGITNHARLYRGGGSLGVDVEDAVEVAGSVNDEPLPDGVARHGGTATASDDLPSAGLGDGDAVTHVLEGAGLENAGGNSAEDGGIAGISRACGHVGAQACARNLGVDAGLQALKFDGISHGGCSTFLLSRGEALGADPTPLGNMLHSGVASG